MTYVVLWHCAELLSSEYAVLDEEPAGARFRGTVALERDGAPCLVRYAVEADAAWRTTAASAEVTACGRSQRLELTADPERGTWTLDGAPAPQLDGCTDVDLGWTPSTNTLPIRRLGRAPGLDAGRLVGGDPAADDERFRVALVRFPELDVAAVDQSYLRLAEDRWRFRMADFEAELVVEPTSGLVVAYGTDLWRGVMHPAPNPR